MDVDIESLVHLEQSYAATGGNSLSSDALHSRFYDEGYEDGFAHGRIHGLIEGRALGREKGYEMFEELGFYEGFALTWKKIYESTGRSEEFVCSCNLSRRCADPLIYEPAERSTT
jgi:predicted transposase YdaD